MLYPVALFVHILGALGYVIALGIVYAAVVGLRHAQTAQTLRLWAAAAQYATRLIPVSAVCILVAGFYMVAVAWRDQTGWVTVAFAAYLLVGIASWPLQYRRIAAIAQQARDLPPAAPLPIALMHRARAPFLWLATNAITAVPVGIVFLMTVKPDLLGSLLALGVALVVGLVAGVLLLRLPAPAAALKGERA
jgi:hypothetical protein